MINANKQAFEFLIQQTLSRNAYSISGGKRYIKTDVNDKKWLQEAVCYEIYQVLPTLRAIKLKFDAEDYFILVGVEIDNVNFDLDVVESIDINAGIITLLLAEQYLKLDSKFDDLAFYDEILCQHMDPLYVGHDYLDIVKYLEPVYVYKLPLNSLLQGANITRILTYIFSKDRNQLVLNFSQDVLQTISEIALVGSQHISYSLILSSMMSTNYKHAFLEIYRLIERLFPVSFLRDFHTKVRTEMSFLEFTATMEDSTGWWPKEIDGIKNIFNSCKPSIKQFFNSFFASSTDLTHKRIINIFIN